GFAAGSSWEFETSGALEALLAETRTPGLVVLPTEKKTRLTLVHDDVPVRGRILNTEGRPVAGAWVEAVNFWGSETGSLDAWDAATKERGATYYSARRHLREFANGNFVSGPAASILPVARTDAEGFFTLKGLGRDRIAEVYIGGLAIESAATHVRSRKGE